MRFFSIDTIKGAIERLQEYKGNWLLPAFVFAANDVGTEELVDISQRLGTDHFLDRYFNGSRLGIEPYPDTGNNLLRPRLKDILAWTKPPFEGDYIVRQKPVPLPSRAANSSSHAMRRTVDQPRSRHHR